MKSIFTALTLCLFSASFFKAQISNMDFESTSVGTYTSSSAVNGWSVSSQILSSCPRSSSWSAGSPKFAVLATPMASVPVIGSLAHSPLGGTHIVQLNNTSGTGYSTKLSRTFSVTSSNTIFQYAYAAIVENGNHTCCDGAFFKVEVLNQSGVLQYCLSYTLSADNGCQSSGSSYSTTTNGGAFWTNWQTKYIDLSAFLNTNVSIEISTSDCTGPGHYGTAFFDAALIKDPSRIDFCSGSNVANIITAPGYQSYQWYNSTGSISATAGQQTLNINNPVSGSIYTVNLFAYSGCVFTSTYALSYSNISILNFDTKPTCPLGTAGSATVNAIGSGSGYTYTWTNASSSVVSSASVINNVGPGNYSVRVEGFAAPGCGTSTAAVSIGSVATIVSSKIHFFCGSEAYFTVSGVANYQWYHASSAITATAGGTASGYTLSTATDQDVFSVGYNSNSGCRDSVTFVLASTSAGSLIVQNNPTICAGAINGSASIVLTPASGVQAPIYSYYLASLFTVTPTYSAALNQSSSNIFTVNGLSAGGIYSVVATDGFCKYTKTFSISPYVFSFSVSPGSATLCPGEYMHGVVVFTSTPSTGQYSYSWTPATFLLGTNSQNMILTPTVSPGVVTTIIYSVVVTPTVINCPQTKTIAITIANPLTPTITAIPSMCTNAGTYTINVNPSGGTFINGTSLGIDPLTGIFSPSLQPIGLNTFTYANSVGTCVAKSSGSFVIDPLPVISVSGNTILCEGQSSTLLASGANTFTWSNSQVSPFISVNPQAPTSYTVEGTDANTNCSNSKTVTVNVVPYPLITVVGNTLLCPGESASLVAMGAFTYSWSNGTFTYLNVVSPNTTTTYSVIGISYLSSCSSTAAITVSPSDCNFVGLQERNLSDGVSVYPNPTNGKVTINCKETFSFILIDGLGRQLVEEKYKTGIYAFDLSDFPAGVYFLNLKNGNKSSMLKLIKTD